MLGVPFLQAGRSWFLLIVESVPSRWSWTSGLSRFPGWGNLYLCSGGIELRREEGGRRGDTEEKRKSEKGREQSSQ